MPNAAKPARLWLRTLPSGKQVYVIKDCGKQVASTGYGPDDLARAEEELAKYIGSRFKPNRDSGRDPAAIQIAELLLTYQHDKPGASSDDLGRRIEALIKFFDQKPLSALSRNLCREYAKRRGEQPARRELEDLRAALGYAFQEKILMSDCRAWIELPPKAPPRERWLTRSEAARLIWAAWRYREVQKGHATGRRSRQHVARFILVALYTGTRSAAVCEAAMGPAIGRGYVDLDEGMFYRRARGTAETNKCQPTIQVPDRLLAHMRRWKRRGISLKAVVEFNGEPVQSVKKAFARCVGDARLDERKGKVTPHTLRHTAISWSLQNGKRTEEVSAFFGVSPQVITSVYSHHCTEQQRDVANSITRKRLA